MEVIIIPSHVSLSPAHVLLIMLCNLILIFKLFNTQIQTRQTFLSIYIYTTNTNYLQLHNYI